MSMDEDGFFPAQRVSYLQARDPSIISYNRQGLIRHNLLNDFSDETSVEVPTTSIAQKQNNLEVFLRIKSGINPDHRFSTDGNDYNVNDRRCFTKYTFSQIFQQGCSQKDIFDDVIKEKVLNLINGTNCTQLAHGASGSGKTYTMIGTVDEPGIIPRALEYLFEALPRINELPDLKPTPEGRLQVLSETEKAAEAKHVKNILSQVTSELQTHRRTYKGMQQRLSQDPVTIITKSASIVGVWVSFAEIYNESIYDLLDSEKRQHRPKLPLSRIQDNIFIKGLKFFYVTTGMDAFMLLQYGLQNLNYASTAVNNRSSRSHCIFSIRLVQGLDANHSNISTFSFCDLAGAERVNRTLNVGDRLDESKKINNSLMVLGKCISIIRNSQKRKNQVLPPFRESKLTHLFQRPLMGMEDILMILTINPSTECYEESLQALKFSAIAQEIALQKDPQEVLHESEDDEETIRKLRNKRAGLVLQLSEIRSELEEFNLNYDDNLEEERQHIISIFMKEREANEERMNRLERKLENAQRKYESLVAENGRLRLITNQNHSDNHELIKIDNLSEEEPSSTSSSSSEEEPNKYDATASP